MTNIGYVHDFEGDALIVSVDATDTVTLEIGTAFLEDEDVPEVVSRLTTAGARALGNYLIAASFLHNPADSTTENEEEAA